jgi:hypothetical protein
MIQNKKTFSEMTEEEKKELAKKIAQVWIMYEKVMISNMINEAMTPFWVKWYRKLKAKLTKK